MRISVLGMGRMGRALAGRLLDGGHDVTIWNRTPGRAPELVGRGATEAGSAPEAAARAEIVVTILANDDAVRAVTGPDGGIRGALADDALYVDASTVSPELSSELAGAFPRFVAMPILGSPSQVAGGQAIYLIGADDGAAAMVEPLFPHLSEKRRRYDRPATAAAAKVTVNLLLLDGVVALSESFAVGRAGGLSDDQLRDLLGESPMVAPGLKYRFEGILTGDQETFWTAGLGAKDAGLAVDVARSAGVELPVTSTVRKLYEETQESTGGADIALVAQRYRT